MHMKKFTAFIVPAILLLSWRPVLADGMGAISDIIFRIEAQSGANWGEWEAHFGDGTFDGSTYSWDLLEDVNIMTDTGDPVAQLNAEGTSIFLDTDPLVTLNFNVTAGGAATLFTITSAEVMFAAINPAQGRASAGMSATDLNGDGVNWSGAYAGNSKSYIAHYNGLAPAGTNFASLIGNNGSANPFDSIAGAEAFPAVGFSPIAGAVTSISSQFSFTAGALDNVTGNSVFVVVPEPTTLGLLAVGAVVLFRRRR